MAFDKDAFLTALDGMTVLELNELVKAIEEKFGVSAAAMAAAPGPGSLPTAYARTVRAVSETIAIATGHPGLMVMSARARGRGRR